MDIRQIPLDELVLDPDLNLRDRLDSDTVERYVESWDRMPPVTVFQVDGQYLLADGLHRHAAAVALKRRKMQAEVRVGTFADALDYVAGANLHHGLPLTRAERRRAVEVKLRLHHERSDRHLAEELCVGRELIARVRRQLVESGQIPAGETRLGADGKVYPAASLPRDPNERLPQGKSLDTRDDPRDRGGRESDAAPWDDTRDPLPPVTNGAGPGDPSRPPWELGDEKAMALAPPVEVATPTIEEMLAMMARQVMEVVAWTNAEGFPEAYRGASANGRGLFQTAVVRLAARSNELRKGGAQFV